ncbi:MAG: hypothetical protein DHS20C21_09990 [Gemmatimonadota bacterium]|nr:MAG: hypothetical protein DHS20C21_09990 [Gemmatimonadota bacterium]
MPPVSEPNHADVRRSRIALAAVLLIAVGVRLHGLFEDLPFSYYGDELHFVKRAMSLGTGDLNPHWFHKPAFLMYLLLASFGAYFAGGFVLGVFPSVDAFGAAFLVDQGPFLLIGRLLVMLFGMGTVILGERIARQVGGRTGGLVTALVLALLPALVAGSQVVKADVPSAFFVTAAVWAYLRGKPEAWKPIVLAGAFAGASMGTKYYGVIVLPGLVLVELLPGLLRRRSWWVGIRRSVVLAMVFVGAFFVTSPYNFLDPLWPQSVMNRLSDFVQLPTELPGAAHAAGVAEAAGGPGGDGEAESLRFDPDGGVVYEPGLGAVPGAAWHFAGQLWDQRAMGPGFAVLALLGVVGLARVPEHRRSLWVLGTPFAIFTLMAVTLMAYHVNPRQLNAVFPLCATLVWPGICLVGDTLRLRGRSRQGLAIALVLITIVPMATRTWRVNDRAARDDSRNRAYGWILENIPATDRVLLDDYGPILQPNEPAIARLEDRLHAFPEGEGFTEHRGKQLELLRQFPSKVGRNVDVLGHPWWLGVETPDEVLRADPWHRDMGNPLVDRTPRTVAEYEADGYRWIITNREAQRRYDENDPDGVSFPSFHRFYADLRAREPVQVFDPKTWGGKGPVVWVYDLQRS